MDYNGALERLNQLEKYRLQSRDSRRSASAKIRTKEWLTLLGVNDERLREVKFIHVAGTKGKGTTCLYCEGMLDKYRRTKGIPLKIGCLTSPHVTTIRDRIRLDSTPISEQVFATYFSKVWHQIMQPETNESEPLSKPSIPGYPGFLALLGIYILVQEQVDVAIVETGVGGEKDSTNVIPRPIATGITTIGIDHTNILGDDVGMIAWHKAGIFKQDSPAFTVKQDDAVLRVLRHRANEKHTPGGLRVISEGLTSHFGVTVQPDLPFQRGNAALAIALVEAFLRDLDPTFVMTSSLASSVQKTKLPGRNEIIRQGPLDWYITSAHNNLSIEVASIWFREAANKLRDSDIPRVLIFSQEPRRDSTLEMLYKTLFIDDFILSDAVFCSTASGIGEKLGINARPLFYSKLIVKDFYDPRQPGPPTPETAQRHAAMWNSFGGRGDVVTTLTVKDAIELVQSKYTHSGAIIFVAGDSKQAGAATFLLGAK